MKIHKFFLVLLLSGSDTLDALRRAVRGHTADRWPCGGDGRHRGRSRRVLQRRHVDSLNYPMRALLSLAALIVVVALVAWVTQKQLRTAAEPSVPAAPTGAPAPVSGERAPSLKGQLDRLQRDVQQTVQSAASRAEP